MRTTNYRNRLIKGIADEDWIAFSKLKAEHNKEFPKNKISMRKFFQLLNTYSPLITQLMHLDPKYSAVQNMSVNTALSLAPMWIENTAHNIALIKEGKDIKELHNIYKGKPAIVIGAGPSLYDNASGTNHLELIKEYANNFDGVILIADRLLEQCIDMELGDYVCIVDGSQKIYDLFFDNDVVKAYNDITIYDGTSESGNAIIKHSWEKQERAQSDFDMKAVMATSVNKEVMSIWERESYYFVPSIPQEVLPNATSIMCEFTGKSDINAGGNCGMLAWNMATYMGCTEIAMVGMDLSYKIDTPIEETQSYKSYIGQLGEERVHEAFRVGKHPFFKTPYRTDYVYETFITTAIVWIKAFKDRGICTTYNCTEGGAIHGKGVEYMYLQEFLDKHSNGKEPMTT